MKALKHLFSPALGSPIGQHGRFKSSAGGFIRILIGDDVDTFTPRSINHGDNLRCLPPNTFSQRLDMRNHDGQVRLAADLDRFGHCAFQTDVVAVLVAQVAVIDAAHLCGDFCQRNDLVRLREALWNVEQASGHTECALAHSLANEVLFALEFIGSRRAIGHGEHLLAHRAEADEQRRVGADSVLVPVIQCCCYRPG